MSAVAGLAASVTRIRHATAADVPAIVAVHLDGWRWAYQGTPMGEVLDALPGERRAEMWIRILDRYAQGVRLWVGERDDQLAGFVCTGPPRGPTEHREGASELYALYQLRACAGTGLGHTLVTHALADLQQRHFSEVYLWAMASNQRARRFYERGGWRPLAEQLFVHQDQELPHVCYGRSLLPR